MLKFERYPFNEMEVEDNVKVLHVLLIGGTRKSIILVEKVDETIVDPSSELVQVNQRIPIATASTTHALPVTTPYATVEDMVRLENNLDDLNRKDYFSRGAHYLVESTGGSPIVHFDEVELANGSPIVHIATVELTWGSPTLYINPMELVGDSLLYKPIQ
ncbi:hypothetical protein FNV43_RR19127 [Rhamnella rubrinervis]|uniref:Uncharacterized protein n=1 Tax=Rhamnella rubrinervis TaxID=2594499 RepID=A0A8K0E207_9ROSA|nr:hypothetical protein FNV43_RR19127 [Rhamnella rubrinervis]